jgi:hypothetical protein
MAAGVLALRLRISPQSRVRHQPGPKKVLDWSTRFGIEQAHKIRMRELGDGDPDE